MTKAEIRHVARAVVADLFSDGHGLDADRLVLFKEHPDGVRAELGGWSRDAAERAVAVKLAVLLRYGDVGTAGEGTN